MLLINGREVEAEGFYFDGCHKIYLVDSPEAKREMEDHGWSGEELFPLYLLPDAYEKSCWLKFIASGDITRPYYVKQGEAANVVWVGPTG